jgi:hypothetical protein
VKVIFQRRKWARPPARNLELMSQNLEQVGERAPQQAALFGGTEVDERGDRD